MRAGSVQLLEMPSCSVAIAARGCSVAAAGGTGREGFVALEICALCAGWNDTHFMAAPDHWHSQQRWATLHLSGQSHSAVCGMPL